MPILWPQFSQLEWRDERWLSLLYALPLLVILYFLRRRAAVLLVGHLPLWERALKKERKRASLWKELLCLLLLLMVLAASVLLLAGPYERREIPGEGHTVLLMDQSLGTSLKLDAGMSLWDRSVASLLREADEAAGSGSISVAAWADEIQPLTTSTRDADDVRTALRSLRGPKGERSEKALLDLVRGLPAEARIIVVTAFEPPAELRVAVPSVVWRSPLTPMEASLPLHGGVESVEVLPDRSVQLLLSGSLAPRQLVVEVDAEVVLQRPLGEGEIRSRRVVLPASLFSSSRVRIRLDPPDAFAQDDIVPLLVPSPSKATVLVASDEPTPFLDAWLASSEYVDRDQSGRISPTRLRLAQEARSYDVTFLVDAEVNLELLPGNYILMGSTVLRGSMERKGAPREVRYERHEETHELLSGLDFSGWTDPLGQRTELPPKGEALIMGTDGPMLSRWEGSGVRLLEFAQPPDRARTSLPLLPAFPILLDRILASLLPSSKVAERPVRRAGSTVTLKGLTHAAWIEGQEGMVELLPLEEPDLYRLPEVVGRFEWRGEGTEVRKLAVAILDHPGRPGPLLTPSDPPRPWPKAEESVEHGTWLLLLIAALLPAERILRILLLKP